MEEGEGNWGAFRGRVDCDCLAGYGGVGFAEVLEGGDYGYAGGVC